MNYRTPDHARKAIEALNGLRLQNKTIKVEYFAILAFYFGRLGNRAGHYIFALWFLSSSIFLLFSSPYLSGRRLDVYHTSTHGVALVRI